MKSIYACLCGNWVKLNDDKDCVMGNHGSSPEKWWEEGADIYSPKVKPSNMIDSYYGLDYVHITYHGKSYRINPIFIQIVEE